LYRLANSLLETEALVLFCRVNQEDGSMKKAILVFAIFGLLIISGIQGQEPPIGEESPGWLAWSMNVDENTPPRGTGLLPDEFRTLLATIRKIGAFFRDTPFLRTPQGVEISPSRTILKRVGAPRIGRRGLSTKDTFLPEVHPLRQWSGENGPVRAEFRLWIYRPVYKIGNPSCTVSIQINDPWLEGQYVLDDKDGGIYLPPSKAREEAGRLMYQAARKTTVEKLLPAGRNPWIPVSQERWIRALIGKSEKMLEERRVTITADGETRRRRFTQSYEVMKSINPAEAEKMRTAFEKTEEIYQKQAEAIAAEDYDSLEAAGERGLAMLGRHLLTLREELAGLSAAERSEPAYGFEGNPQQYWMPRRKPERPSMLLDAGHQDALPLLAPNPDFFREDIPPTEIQSLTIINRLWPEFNERIQAELDWEALKGMVR